MEQSAPRDSVSVIIPAYNAERFVHEAIESALLQSHPPLEILVIDDGSKDRTAQAVSRYDAPVRLLCKPNGGPASARNLGAREARGRWLAFLDADDQWFPRKIERQLACISTPDVALVHSKSPSPRAASHLPASHSGNLFMALWQYNFIITSTVLLDREVFLQHGGFDEDRALIGVEDYNLWLRLAAAERKFAFCPEVLLVYAPGPDSLSRQLQRFVRAELAQLEKIATTLKLDETLVRDKRLRLYLEYGADLVHARDMECARHWFAAHLLEQPTMKSLGWWLSTLVPKRVLDLRRRLIGRKATLGPARAE